MSISTETYGNIEVRFATRYPCSRTTAQRWTTSRKTVGGTVATYSPRHDDNKTKLWWERVDYQGEAAVVFRTKKCFPDFEMSCANDGRTTESGGLK